jgi:broad specificity phosphatase PhoE
MSKSFIGTPHHFYIFRHGLATLSTSGYGDQIYSAPLLPEAVPPITHLAEYLKPIPSRLNFSSEILRCHQTADLVTQVTGKTFLFDERLNEYHQETFTEFSSRVTEFLRFVIDLADDSATNSHDSPRFENILICTHGAVIACLKNLLLKDSFTTDDELDYTMPGELMILQNGELQVIDFTEVEENSGT